jgi:hypothetical protein
MLILYYRMLLLCFSIRSRRRSPSCAASSRAALPVGEKELSGDSMAPSISSNMMSSNSVASESISIVIGP